MDGKKLRDSQQHVNTNALCVFIRRWEQDIGLLDCANASTALKTFCPPSIKVRERVSGPHKDTSKHALTPYCLKNRVHHNGQNETMGTSVLHSDRGIGGKIVSMKKG